MARVRSLSGPPTSPSRPSIPAGLQQEQLWALARLLEEKSAERPLVIVLDDMHRSTETTLDILVGLSGRLGRAPLLLLAGRAERAGRLAGPPAICPDRAPGAPCPEGCRRPRRAPWSATSRSPPKRSTSSSNERAATPCTCGNSLAWLGPRGPSSTMGTATGWARLPPCPPALQAVLAARLDALGPPPSCFSSTRPSSETARPPSRSSPSGRGDADSILRPWSTVGSLRRNPGGGYEATDPLMREVAYETLPRNVQRRPAPPGSRPGQPARRPGPAPRAGGRVHPRRRLRRRGGGRSPGRAGRAAGLRSPGWPMPAACSAGRSRSGCRRPSALFELARIQETTRRRRRRLANPGPRRG